MSKPVPIAELVAAIAQAHGSDQAEARQALASVQSAVQALLVEGKTVRLTDLATFTSVVAPERHMRNPATGKLQIMPPTRRVRVVPTGILKKAVKKELS